MRLFSVTLTVILIFSAALMAQTPLTVRTFENATRAAQEKEFETAVKGFQQTLLFSEADKPSDDFLVRVHFNLGVCLYNLGKNERAIEEFTESIKLSRRSYQKAFYALGMAHRELKSWDKAASAFREAVTLEKRDGEAWFDLGLVLLEEKDFGTAEKAFRLAIKYKSTGTADAHNNLGVILALRNEFPAAENEFQTALVKSNGKSVEAISNLQFCRLYKRDYNRNLLAKLEFSRRNDGE